MATTDLSGCSDEELRERLSRLTREYHEAVQAVAVASIKAGHIRDALEPLILEIKSREPRTIQTT